MKLGAISPLVVSATDAIRYTERETEARASLSILMARLSHRFHPLPLTVALLLADQKPPNERERQRRQRTRGLIKSPHTQYHIPSPLTSTSSAHQLMLIDPPPVSSSHSLSNPQSRESKDDGHEALYRSTRLYLTTTMGLLLRPGFLVDGGETKALVPLKMLFLVHFAAFSVQTYLPVRLYRFAVYHVHTIDC